MNGIGPLLQLKMPIDFHSSRLVEVSIAYSDPGTPERSNRICPLVVAEAERNRMRSLSSSTRTLSNITKASEAGLAIELKVSMKPSIRLPAVNTDAFVR